VSYDLTPSRARASSPIIRSGYPGESLAATHRSLRKHRAAG
jgi:hypothetical protein